MKVYVVIEHDIKNLFNNRACALYLNKEKADECAREYAKCFFPQKFTVEMAEVIE